MQLDKTAIVITQRSGPELIDLSLAVFRQYWFPVLTIALVCILPIAAINAILLYPLTQYESLLISSRDVSEVSFFRLRYLSIMSAVILIQAPLVLSGVTYFIGQAVFIERPSLGVVFRSIRSKLWSLVYVLGCWRFSLLVFVPMYFLFQDPSFRPEIEIPLYLLCLCTYVYAVRGFRPFAPEILLLERCPLFSSKKRPNASGFSRRSGWLHSTLAFELFGLHLGITLVQLLMTISFVLGCMFVIGVLSGLWKWGIWMDWIVCPMLVWMLMIWSTILRFLSYMNSRIQTEGWELELRLKAESQRLEGMVQG
jgi:hypothetical protein